MAHKSGFVNIMGNPNVGKSTLMNALVGEKLCIITSKAQTTRHRILGIENTEDYQIVYSDTPGLLKPKYKLQEAMLQQAMSALEDADILIYVTDVYETLNKNEEYLQKVIASKVKKLVLINKIDKSDQAKVENLVKETSLLFPDTPIMAVSALERFNIDAIKKFLLENLPEIPPYFPKDQLTDRSMRFFVTEIIREKILLFYDKEIPYSVEIEVEEFKESETIDHIKALIYVAKESQKGILIGHQGSALKKVGTEARKDIENFTGKKAYLELYVKVAKDWRDTPKNLKTFGYLS